MKAVKLPNLVLTACTKCAVWCASNNCCQLVTHGNRDVDNSAAAVAWQSSSTRSPQKEREGEGERAASVSPTEAMTPWDSPRDPTLSAKQTHGHVVLSSTSRGPCRNAVPPPKSPCTSTAMGRCSTTAMHGGNGLTPGLSPPADVKRTDGTCRCLLARWSPRTAPVCACTWRRQAGRHSIHVVTCAESRRFSYCGRKGRTLAYFERREYVYLYINEFGRRVHPGIVQRAGFRGRWEP